MIRIIPKLVKINLIVLVLARIGGCADQASDETSANSFDRADNKYSNEALPEFNQIVLSLITEYPTDGTHTYWWPNPEESEYDGGTQDNFLLGVRVMEGEPQQRTFCCGLTLEVFLRAYNEYLDRHGIEAQSPLSVENWDEFQGLWFVPEVNGSGPSLALETFGLGRDIPVDEVLPGDFVQIWRRSGSGHSVIFREWIRDPSSQEITGFEYWSSQPYTNGIGYTNELFAPAGAENGMALEHTHFGRVEFPDLEVTEHPAETEDEQREEEVVTETNVCDYLCSDYSSFPGECYLDVNGYSWECSDDGCLRQVDSCNGSFDSGGSQSTCDYLCTDYSSFPGECFVDMDGVSWLCNDDGCLVSVNSCS